ncbi:hypothetical protein [Chryseobacterium luteum]|uniref:Uncharacterized protein n=1 Tax=Chryseobacterium luteum TaxID=421531 RepID=A0A085ZX64_9FLAO|nr:hypothetical protein [Chryseobacterium luteum]KFF09028.1 hypothetical protein IX38_00480 [Chryseobacterium luteum]
MNIIKPLGVPIVEGVGRLKTPMIQSVKALGLYLKESSGEYSADFYGLEPGQGVSFPKLLQYLKSNQKSKLYYGYFRGARIAERKAVSRYGVVETGKLFNKTIPFTYINEYKQKIETTINCGINKREDHIEDIPYFSLNVNYKNKTINCGLNYFYINTEKYRKSIPITATDKDFTINDKYKAIKLFSENISDMYHLVAEIQGKDNAEWYKDLVNEHYINLVKNTSTAEELIWLYENAADFTLSALSQELLWKHICTFYSYDTLGTFSFVKDASLSLMRALFAFDTSEKIKYLMEQFHKNQSFVKKIYDALDGTMTFGGKEQKCQTIFASIITGFCFADISSLNFTNEIFYVGKDYYVNVTDVKSDDKEQSKYWAEQRHKNETYYVDSGTALIEMGGDMVLISKVKLHPLDVVTLLQKDTDSLLCVPVLFLKDIDHQKDIQNLLTAVRIGVDMLAIGLTIATLGGASPLLAVAGALEIGIAVTDIAVMTNKDKLSEEFLKTWEKIYLIGGIATASPLVVSSLYKLGGKILASSAKAEMKNFVRSCMMKMILEGEISNFTKNTLKIANEETIAKVSEFFFDRYSFKTFWEQGCQLVYGEVRISNKVEKEVGLLYNGVIVLEGSIKEMRPQLMKLYTARYSKATLEALLENLYKLIPKLDKTKRFWTCFNEAGAELKWGKLSTKEIEKNIESAINNTKTSVQWEGEVAKAFSEIDEVKQIGTKVEYRNSGMNKFELAGDYDVLTEKYLIECKESVSKNINSKFLEQFDKYLDPKNEKYINIGKRKIVLAIKSFKDNALNLSHPVLQQLKNKGVIMITDINQIKNLK